jgi:hypothetical protein
VAAEGEVTLRLEGRPGASIHGALKDISPRGFRAAHDCRDLSSGQIVRFAHAHAAGLARVAWTRITGLSVESGFCYFP